MRSVVLLVAVTIAVMALVSEPVSAAYDHGRHHKTIRRIHRRTAANAELQCDADMFASAMMKARMGQEGWWDDVVGGLKTAVNVVGDALNVVKLWECNRCEVCMDKASWFSNGILDKLLNLAIDQAVQPICITTFDAAAMGLCAAVCGPIPVLGVCPIVCPPFIVFAHQKCVDLLDIAVQELKKVLLTTAKAAIRIDAVPALKPETICTKLGLCPLKRTDCGKDRIPPLEMQKIVDAKKSVSPAQLAAAQAQIQAALTRAGVNLDLIMPVIPLNQNKSVRRSQRPTF